MSVLDRLQFYLMHFMPYPDVAPGRPQGQWVDIPNTHFDPEKGHKLYKEYLSTNSCWATSSATTHWSSTSITRHSIA
jgi:hypothetical protein